MTIYDANKLIDATTPQIKRHLLPHRVQCGQQDEQCVDHLHDAVTELIKRFY